MNEQNDLVNALIPVAQILRELEVRHYVGGSVASSFHGATKSTMDVDLVCELTDAHVTEILSLIGNDYYASESAMRQAVRQKSSFNLIHLPTSFKVDIFVSRKRPFDEESMARATIDRIGDTPYVELPLQPPRIRSLANLSRID